MKVAKLLLVSALLLSGGIASVGVAEAVSPSKPKCWGVVSSQFARSQGGLGEHASSKETPRLGLGNVARAFGFDHVSELGTFLAGIDGIPETSCP